MAARGRRCDVTGRDGPGHRGGRDRGWRFAVAGCAVVAASPGTAIVVRPGVYRGTELIDIALDIAGQGDRDTIIVRAEAGHVMVSPPTRAGSRT